MLDRAGSIEPNDLAIIGVDCATNPKKVGLALASWTEGRARLDEVCLGGRVGSVEECAAGWLAQHSRCLIALDAPLGWPIALGARLVEHEAGALISTAANAMFRRRTDDVVYEMLGKRPLDVGADRIARTAHVALGLIDKLRRATGWAIPLAWSPGPVEGCAAIEVYPAATLASRGIRSTGYKTADAVGVAARQSIVAAIAGELDIPAETRARLAASDHLLDAALCVVAAVDFLRADVLRPADTELACKEGWIWVRGRPAAEAGR